MKHDHFAPAFLWGIMRRRVDALRLRTRRGAGPKKILPPTVTIENFSAAGKSLGKVDRAARRQDR